MQSTERPRPAASSHARSRASFETSLTVIRRGGRVVQPGAPWVWSVCHLVCGVNYWRDARPVAPELGHGQCPSVRDVGLASCSCSPVADAAPVLGGHAVGLALYARARAL